MAVKNTTPSSVSSSKTTLSSNYDLKTLLSFETKEEGRHLQKLIEKNPGLVQHKYFGDEPNNAGNIHLNGKPEASAGERITNGCDAKIEEAIYNGLAAQYDNPFDIGEAVFDANKTGVSVASRPVHLRLKGKYDKKAKSVTMDVRDYGIGIPVKRMLKTILNSKSGTKSSDPRYIGRYGHGGSTTFSHSNFSMVVSRHINSKKVGVAFVKYCAPGDMNPITGEEQRRSGTYLTLVDPNTGEPFVFNAFDTNGNEIFKPGTHIRHFEYEMDPRDLVFYSKPTRQKSSLYKTMRTMFPNPPIPFAVFDDRMGAKGTQLHYTVYGSFRSLSSNVKKKVEYDNSATVPVGKGNIKLYWFIIDEDSVRDNYINNFVNYGYSGNVFLSGQTIETLPAQIVRDSGIPFLEKGIVLFADLDGLDDRTKDRVMTATRESLNTNYRNLIHEHLVSHLKEDDRVQEIHQERRNNLTSTPSNQDTIKQLKKYFENYLTGSGNSRTPNPNPKPKVSPTPIAVANSYIKVISPRRALYPGQKFSIRFQTDIDNSRFDQNFFEITAKDPQVLEVSNWSISDNQNATQGHKTLAGLQVNPGAQVGDFSTITLKVKLPNQQEVEVEIACAIVEKPDPKKTSQKVPDFDVKWVNKNQTDLIRNLDLFDEDGNVMEDKVGHVERGGDGSITVYLARFNEEVVAALKAIEDNGTAKTRYDHYQEFFLSGYFDFQVAAAASAFLLKDDGQIQTPSPKDTPDTELETVMKSAARSAVAYWKVNLLKIAN